MQPIHTFQSFLLTSNHGWKWIRRNTRASSGYYEGDFNSSGGTSKHLR
jgi:hypothetical protein